MECNYVIEGHNIIKKYKNFTLDVENLKIPKGFATALIGENGAGKTTLLDILAGIMDDELMANQSNFAKSIKDEVKEKKEGDYSISTYVVQTREPEQVKVGGKKMCTVDCQFYLRKGSTGVPIYYQFVLRRDDNGKWKILGWEALDNN